MIAEVADEIGWADNLRRLVNGCRDRGASIVHCPFCVSVEADGAVLPYVGRLRDRGVLVEGSRGTEIPDELFDESDIVLSARRQLNVFYGTDLQERLEDCGVTHLLVAGSVANAGVDSTGRMGVELEYDVTYVADGIAALSPEEWEASVEVTFGRMAHRVLVADEVDSPERWSRAGAGDG